MSRSSVRRVVCTRLMGGLGNQMFQYALARAIAIRHDAEVVLDASLLESSNPALTKREFALDGFRINARIATQAEVDHLMHTRGPLGVVRRIVDKVRPVRMRRVIYEKTPAFRAEVLRARPPAYLSGYWQSERYFTAQAPAIREDFSLRDGMSPRARSYEVQIRARPSVSIHVRRGDYARNKAILAVHGLLPSAYYKEAFARIAKVVGNPSVFVFSDDLDWARENLNLGAETFFVDLAGEKSDHSELHLMAACNHHVISNSSFGWWGAWLGGHPEKLVVAPRSWFADPSVRTDIVPARWMRA